MPQNLQQHLPHHDGSPLHVSNPYPQLGETVRARLRVPHAFGAVKAVYTRSNPDQEPRFLAAELVHTADGWDWWEAPVDVENPVTHYRWLVVRADERTFWVNATGVHDIETRDNEDFRLTAFPEPPHWLREGVLYQIFPDRFARSDAAASRPAPEWAIAAAWGDPVDLLPPGRSHQFYGGDLDGVIEHLDHLQSLGVSIVYLTPMFAGRSNHRYDASDFNAVDPLLGGDDALIRLVEAVHARGMKIIGDLTTNHCGDGHEWFQAALGRPEAPESEFFYWLNDEHTDYVGWLGVPSLPKFNWASAELRRRFIEGADSVVGRWLRHPFDLDGWRIDVANMTGRYGKDDFNAEVRQTVRRTMDEVNPDTILLGESTNDGSADFQGDGWQGAMTYANFTRPLWGWLSEPGARSPYFGQPVGVIPTYSGAQFLEAHRQFGAGFPWRSRLGNMNALDTHDIGRFATNARAGAVPVALGMSATFVGMPVIWAGDEFGLTGVDGEASRTPMPWGATDAATESVLWTYRAIMPHRGEHPALTDGGMRWLRADDDVLVYVREHASEAVLCVAARAGFRVRLATDAVLGASSATRLFGPAELRVQEPVDEDEGFVELAADGISFTMWELPGVGSPDF
ncbi:MAG: glycoside hydrolase family 13 protein [Microbacteriaceae bacterium]|nr:glycoside hydrolase family 13 protein [Microbacteriaceae bacterium]MCL2796163.1 glycoside hydrolase family 13 protein [Microbacteriaceae bacterium]